MSSAFLVVAEEEDLRGVPRTLLSGSGSMVIEAADGKVGVAKARSDRPQLILVDQLPVLDGYDVTRQIKASPNLSEHRSWQLGRRPRCVRASRDAASTRC